MTNANTMTKTADEAAQEHIDMVAMADYLNEQDEINNAKYDV